MISFAMIAANSLIPNMIQLAARAAGKPRLLGSK
jgi:hypothetical protein